jgi:hypothetical protein
MTSATTAAEGFHLPASQRQMKKISALRSLRLCLPNLPNEIFVSLISSG